jgi:iron complex transport system ATP-binding protein
VIAPPTLQAKNITVRAGDRALLDGVTLTLPSGSMTALLGPNGAGKTTLIRVLAGILPVSVGDVYLGNLRLHALGRSATARQCAYLPQQTGTGFEMRVEDVVALGRYPHVGTWGRLSRADYDRVRWAMERVGLTALRHRTLPTLSGGERQRVFLARALAQEAPILLLDEPLTALDIGRQLELMALLAELHHDGHTILAALHDLRPAVDFFPQAILLSEGRLTAAGPTGAVVFGQAFESAFGVRVSAGKGLCLCPITEAAEGQPQRLLGSL